MRELIKLAECPVKDVLDKLLQDKSTGENIVFATDTYRYYGAGYSEFSYMTARAIRGFASCNIQPRVYKSLNEQNERTRKMAEVFTPSRIVNKMNNFCDAEWFGRADVFNREIGGSWEAVPERAEFSGEKGWQAYVDSRRLEITCGEAPYIVSRYDPTTGDLIDIERRIGILDRKLRVVGENTLTEKEWLKWATRAVESVYGYEFQGDNLLIARINVLSTFCDYLESKWHRQATKSELCSVANRIAWNFWQMDGLKGIAPFGSEHEDSFQFSLVDKPTEREEVKCKVYDWRAKCSVPFEKMRERGKGMKFDFVIGNPPYQDENEDSNRQEPIYNYFMDASYAVGGVVELITPARFLFDAGQTPKAWNEQMLNDEHFSVLFFEKDSSNVFSNTDIKGGVAITIRNEKKNYGKIGNFTEYGELNAIKNKVDQLTTCSLSKQVYPKSNYGFTENVYSDYPECKNRLTKGNEYIIDANIFEKIPEIFASDMDNGIKVHGRQKNARVFKYIKKEYIKQSPGLDKFKVLVPGANGSGKFGETLSSPFIALPNEIHTQTYMSIGCFDSEYEANSCLLYLKTKFARSMLGILKVTQNNAKSTWKYVPLQDFSRKSDIDWSKSIPEIDKQLYKKYGLSKSEIKFIETHVKEME